MIAGRCLCGGFDLTCCARWIEPPLPCEPRRRAGGTAFFAHLRIPLKRYALAGADGRPYQPSRVGHRRQLAFSRPMLAPDGVMREDGCRETRSPRDHR